MTSAERAFVHKLFELAKGCDIDVDDLKNLLAHFEGHGSIEPVIPIQAGPERDEMLDRILATHRARVDDLEDRLALAERDKARLDWMVENKAWAFPHLNTRSWYVYSHDRNVLGLLGATTVNDHPGPREALDAAMEKLKSFGR